MDGVRMSSRCQRCDFRETDEPDTPTLAEHAEDAEHPLCAVNARHSLRDDEQGTCTRCIARVRATLATIVSTFSLLPAELVHHASEHIPGGDAMVMLGPGSAGDQAVYGEHRHDALPSDPESVADTLAGWEDTVRHELRHPASSGPPDVAAAARYLNEQLTTIARGFDAFGDFAADLARVLTRLQVITATADWPLYGARCQYDDQVLVRAYDEPKRCGHVRPAYERRRLPGSEKLEPTKDAVARWNDAVRLYEQRHARCKQGGLTSHWACPACKRRYTESEYRLALRRQHAVTAGWMPVHIAADLAETPEKTLRTWVERGRIGALCQIRWYDDIPVRTGTLMVFWPDILRRLADALVA